MSLVVRLTVGVIVGVIVTALLDNYWVGHSLIAFLVGVLAFLLIVGGDHYLNGRV